MRIKRNDLNSDLKFEIRDDDAAAIVLFQQQ